MAKAILIHDNDSSREYQIADGRIITLKIDDDSTEVTYHDSLGNQLGEDGEFVFVDEDLDSNCNSYLLARMYVPIKRSGLGRASLEYFRDLTGASIYTRANDGLTRDDGSHLTEDAPGFVSKMQTEGLIINDMLDL